LSLRLTTSLWRSMARSRACNFVFINFSIFRKKVSHPSADLFSKNGEIYENKI
jgi:hypothetical protein